MLEENRKRIDELEKKLEKKEINLNKLNLKNEEQMGKTTIKPCYQNEFIGANLSDFVIEKYNNGNLGMKTLLKSLNAWIKFKVKNK